MDRKLKYLDEYEARVSINTLTRIEDMDRRRLEEWEKIWQDALLGVGPHPFAAASFVVTREPRAQHQRTDPQGVVQFKRGK